MQSGSEPLTALRLSREEWVEQEMKNDSHVIITANVVTIESEDIQEEIK